MYPLIYFLLGIVFIQVVLPILTSATDFILTWLEVRKLSLSVKAAEYNNEIILKEAPPAHQIGFTYTPQEEEEDDYD